MTTTDPRLAPSRRRLLHLVAAGLVDSFCLSLAWTVVLIELTRRHGLVAAGVCSTAMMVGVALSAPVASWMSQRLDGRRLLRTAGGVEAGLRVGVLMMLAWDVPVFMLAACVALMNVVAWTGYAGMRAEVATVSEGAKGLTWYGTVVAAVEAVGVAAGALVPLGAGGSPSPVVLTAVALVYVGALVPTLVVAGGSCVPRALSQPPTARINPRPRRVRPPSRVAVAGALLMSAASGPTLLAVALASELHGSGSVGLSAAAFMAGSLVAPSLAGTLDRAHRNHGRCWLVLATGMVVGWATAAHGLVWLCLAQVLSGLCMTTLEGLLDTRASRERPDAVTAALARATAARAFGASAGTAVLPILVSRAGLSNTAVTLAAILASLAFAAQLAFVSRRPEAGLASSPLSTAGPSASVDPAPSATGVALSPAMASTG